MAGVQSHYEINVSRLVGYGKYVHLFATAERSATSLESAQELVDILQDKFPAPEYQITVIYWQCGGKDVTSLM